MKVFTVLALAAIVGCETGQGAEPGSGQSTLPDAGPDTLPDAARVTSPDFRCGGYGGASCPTGFDCLWDNGCCDQFHSCGVSADNTCATSADCLPGYG